MSALDGLLAVVNRSDVAEEVRQLRAESAALYAAQPFKEGDRATLAVHLDLPSDSGWYGYREVLVVGMPGTVRRVEWNGYHEYVAAFWTPDVVWSVSDWASCVHRYLKDDASRGMFSMHIDSLRVEVASDVAPEFPGYCTTGEHKPGSWLVGAAGGVS